MKLFYSRIPISPEKIHERLVVVYGESSLSYATVKMWAVCVEVLRSSPPKWVMSSAVSLPKHTFTGQA